MDVVANETIDVMNAAGTYHGHADVEVTFPGAGDSATFLTVREVGGVWKIDCEFANQSVVTLTL